MNIKTLDSVFGVLIDYYNSIFGVLQIFDAIKHWYRFFLNGP